MTSTPITLGGEEIAAGFRGHGKAAALMPYLMGGFPTLAASRDIGEACLEAGADILELGLPFSDPLADGPVIQAAATEALRQGTMFSDVLDVGRGLSGQIPVVLMTYANVVLAQGPDRFAHRLREAGISGVIVADLPLRESSLFRETFDDAGLALVPLVAPNTPEPRMAEIGAHARGFLYTVAVKGTTGERKELGSDVGEIIQRARRSTNAPVALGFGISTPQHARQAADLGAQGVIIASRLIRESAEASDPAAAVGAIVGEVAEALRD